MMDKSIHSHSYVCDHHALDSSQHDEWHRAEARRKSIRHSRSVRLLKIAIPGLSILIVLVMAAMIAISSYLSNLGLGTISLTSDGLVMDKPELSGHDGDRSYRVTATRAIQRISDPRIFDLEAIIAELHLDKKQRISITANAGTYQSQDESLELTGGIDVTTNEDQSAHFEELFVDLKSGSLTTNSPVSITTAHGTLKATRMRFNKADGTLQFTDGISMTLQPPARENNK